VNLWQALNDGKSLLSPVSDEPGVEAELLLRHALNFDRGQLYRRLTEPLDPPFEKSYRGLLAHRVAHEPTPYILGHKEFFGLDFEVSPAAIIPRPETEALVEEALSFVRDRRAEESVVIVDVGTGCGAIAVSLAHLLPTTQLIAIDISPDALALARRNADKHVSAQPIIFLQGNLLEPLETTTVGLILANLPYIPTAAWAELPPEIRDQEPRQGLDGGPDGLREIAGLIAAAPEYLADGGRLVLEIGDGHGTATTRLALDAFPNARIGVQKDLAGLDRVLVVQT
jgi:release factor glutamine methyltransferase